MIIKYLNESTFGSYKNKLSKEDRLNNIKKETSKLIKKEQIKELLPLFKKEISNGIKSTLYTFRKWGGHPILHFALDNDAKLDGWGSPWGDPKDEEYICTPILEIEGTDTLIVKIPMYFKEMGELIFISNQLFIEHYTDKFNRYYFLKNKDIKDTLEKFGIENIKVKIFLTNESYDIPVDLVRFNHFGNNLNDIHNFFGQFDSPVHIITKNFDTWCSFGYTDDLCEYKDLAKYITATETVNISIQNTQTLVNIDNIKEIFSPDSSHIIVNLILKDTKSYGVNPSQKPVSEELLKKYFGLTYKEIVEQNPVKEWGRDKPWESRLSNIQFEIDNPFDFNKLKNVKFYCTKY